MIFFQKFLLYEENPCNLTGTVGKADLSSQSKRLGITIKSGTAKWIGSSNENTLTNINLEVVPGRLVAVIGPVGAGKVSE